MRKSQFTESQIVAFIRRHEQGEPVVDVCRDAGISQGTFYQWKAKYSGMDSSQLKKLKDLEAEVLRYQRLVGQQALQISSGIYIQWYSDGSYEKVWLDE